MYEYPFNPANKDPAGLVADDLVVLRNVAEGWYVDYKRESLDVGSIAKHMSAFANQFGGWLYFGVEEANDGSRTAGAFPGIPKQEIPALSLKIREAIGAHVTPPLLYEEHVIYGPSDIIGLAAHHAVVIVGIPQGPDPPYIHSSGRVFRRLADQSKPGAEVDRHALDGLWERGKSFRSKISDRLRRTPELPEEQEQSTWAFIFLVPDLRLPWPATEISYEAFRRITRNEHGELAGSTSMPLQEVRSSEFGFIARQSGEGDPQFAKAGFRWWHDGVARLDIPISTWGLEEFGKHAMHYSCSKSFVEELLTQGHNDPSICDFSMLLYGIASLTNLYLKLRETTSDERPLYTACELRNVFYKVPFFNSLKYIEKCRVDRIPVVTDRVLVFPERPYFDNMFNLIDRKTADEIQGTPAEILAATPFFRTAPIMHWILNSVGIASDAQGFATDPDIFRFHGA
jgi:hypothetical protein